MKQQINYFPARTNIKKKMNNILTFGRFKGIRLADTPQWYQDWAENQPNFMARLNKNESKMQKAEKAYNDASKGVRNWNGTSRKGQAAYDAMFEAEKAMADASDSDWFNETFGY